MKQYSNKEARAIVDAIKLIVSSDMAPDAKPWDVYVHLAARFEVDLIHVLQGSPTLERDFDRYVKEARERGEI